MNLELWNLCSSVCDLSYLFCGPSIACLTDCICAPGSALCAAHVRHDGERVGAGGGGRPGELLERPAVASSCLGSSANMEALLITGVH